MNPWGLTANEERIVASVCEHNSLKRVALTLNMTLNAVREGFRRARHRMAGTSIHDARKKRAKVKPMHTIAACIAWDRWANRPELTVAVKPCVSTARDPAAERGGEAVAARRDGQLSDQERERLAA